MVIQRPHERSKKRLKQNSKKRSHESHMHLKEEKNEFLQPEPYHKLPQLRQINQLNQSHDISSVSKKREKKMNSIKHGKNEVIYQIENLIYQDNN